MLFIDDVLGGFQWYRRWRKGDWYRIAYYGTGFWTRLSDPRYPPPKLDTPKIFRDNYGYPDPPKGDATPKAGRGSER